MGIHADENLYRGINAHLNSFLQNEPGGWDSFHIEHLVDLRRKLDEKLPLSYYCRTIESFQLRAFREYEDDTLTALMIYQFDKDNPAGRAITRIELLSTASKPGGQHHKHYMAKRLALLQNGTPLVEIDYLHQTKPLVRVIPSYADGRLGGRPYMFLVTDPRPTFEETVLKVYEFGVDEPIPALEIPLAGHDRMAIHIGPIYDRTFASSRFFRLVVDYAQEPVQFERYQPIDQQRIRWRMEQIRTRKNKGKS